MKKSDFLKNTGLIATGLLSSQFATAAESLAKPNQSKPNIIFILADDLGFAEIGCNGADKYKTPNIDKLAADGMRFTNAYTAPLSGPSRATILTGRHLFRTGATNQDACAELKPTVERMTPTYLKKAGYASTMIGKWGQVSLTPDAWGFDDYLNFKGSGIYWNTQAKGKEYDVNGVIVPLKDKEYMPDVMHQRMVNFITKNRNKPFFAYYSLSHIHNEILPTPDSKPNSTDLYDDNIKYMDKLVGKLRAELDRLGLSKNTVVIFFGDNGTAGAQADKATIGGRRLIGQKGSMQEGGSLEPLIVYWPGVTAKGAVCTDLVSAVDFVPTFNEIAGVSNPTDRILDGKSFLPQLRGQKVIPNRPIFVQLANMYYVRSKEYKLNQKGELYDMSKAPFEEMLVPLEGQSEKAATARVSLQTELDRLNPKGGYIDKGDGTGRHANKEKKEGKKVKTGGDE